MSSFRTNAAYHAGNDRHCTGTQPASEQYFFRRVPPIQSRPARVISRRPSEPIWILFAVPDPVHHKGGPLRRQKDVEFFHLSDQTKTSAVRGIGMPITASVLYDLVRCPHRVSLDAFGDSALRDKVNPFVRLLWERGTLYERAVISGLAQPFLDLSTVEPAQKEQLTLEAIARGERLVYGGRVAAGDLLGMPDLLRKTNGGYIPGDIKAAAAEEGGGEDNDGRPKLHYAVQLALYVDIL